MAADRSIQSPDSRPAFEDARLQLARLHVVGAKSLRDVWLQLAELVATTLSVERVGLWVLIDDKRAIRCRYLLQSSSRELFQGVVLRANDFPQYFAALAERRVIAASDALKSPITGALHGAYLEPLGISSLLDAPIYIDGQLVGVVCHEHIGPPRAWTDPECDFASAVADNIARLYGEYERQSAETALEAHQRHLMELHRMEAVGRVAAGIAHDLRSIVGAARGFAELIRRAPGVTPQIDRYAQRIIEALDRSNQLTREVTEFGRDEGCMPQVLDPCGVIDNIVPMLRVLLGQNVALTCDLRRPVSRVFISTSQLERALLNLALNARDAMAGGGQLSIDVEDATVENDEGESATYVMLSVADSGVGMDAETRANALKPFFTTKGEKGTGLGLAIVEQIVARAGGFVRIDSALGRGTIVRMYVPRIATAS